VSSESQNAIVIPLRPVGESRIVLQGDEGVGPVPDKISMKLMLGGANAGADREAILRALHEERRRVETLRRLGQMQEREADYLADLQKDIDRLGCEAQEESLRSSSAMTRLEELAERTLRLARPPAGWDE
jgi:hypothetical protein